MVQGQEYGLRARISRRPAALGFGAVVDESNPAAIATVAAGLKMGEIIPSERAFFAGKMSLGDYLDARCAQSPGICFSTRWIGEGSRERAENSICGCCVFGRVHSCVLLLPLNRTVCLE